MSDRNVNYNGPMFVLRSEYRTVIKARDAHIAELETQLANAQTTLEADLEYQRKLEAELAEALAERDAYSDQTDQQDLDIKFLSGRNTDLKDDLAKANKVIDAIDEVGSNPYAYNNAGGVLSVINKTVFKYRKKAGS